VIELDELKLQLGLSTTSEYDELLELLEPDAISFISERSGAYIGEPESTLEYRDGGNGVSMILASDPILELESIETRSGVSLTGGSVAWATEDLADYLVVDRRIESLVGVFPPGQSNVRITYKRGYAIGSEPGFVRQAVKELVEQWFRDRVTATGGIAPRPESELVSVPRTVELAIQKLNRFHGV
jgi:hypothetical protein